MTSTAPADPNRRFLGRFAQNQSVSLTVSLPTHSTVSLGFDFYAIASWDGSNVGSFNDRFDVAVDGVSIFNESFAAAFLRNRGRLQTFGPGATNPPATGATEINTLGYNWGRTPADMVYRLEFPDLAHTASTLNISFAGLNLQPITDESWGIDNVEITAC